MEELIKKAAADITDSNYAIALTGAGMSTESGIADFRGPKGVWTLDPEAEKRAYRSYRDFSQDPKGWWENVLTDQQRGEPIGNLEQAMPNNGHYALAELEKMGILKCTITQNIDSLHEKAGTEHLLEYHGSVAKLRCISCNFRLRRDEINTETLIREYGLPPRCPKCQGIIKSDGVFFGEPIPSDVAEQSLEQAWKCDLMLICGTSAVVFPFANLPRVARQAAGTTIIEVNAESTPLTEERISDYIVMGKTGEILPAIVEEVKKIKQLS
ncbi:Sir2 family NAD-dependent protein deacetylase [Chloroflexota bacterium]